MRLNGNLSTFSQKSVCVKGVMFGPSHNIDPLGLLESSGPHTYHCSYGPVVEEKSCHNLNMNDKEKRFIL